MREKYGYAERVDVHLPSAPRKPTKLSKNTKFAYRQAIEHFETSWGGYLPATTDNIVSYLIGQAGLLATATIKLHLAALSHWHVTGGFFDPTKSPLAKATFKSICVLHPISQAQATPLQLDPLELIHGALAMQASLAEKSEDWVEVMRCRRDIAMLLIGFWRGFHSDELCRLHAEHIKYENEVAMWVHLPRIGDGRRYAERTFSLPALSRLCPVQAYSDWLAAADIISGPVFRAISQHGALSESGLSRGSVDRIIRSILKNENHSSKQFCRRSGFAHWANSSDWDLRFLMSYVGWKNEKAALPYLDSAMSFGDLMLNPSWALPPPGVANI
ncbi:hypothetical protein PSCT_04428 [Pseudomonas sp. SCT]|uniref:hypothetical protein n=1 Tax=Pseudomonas sp. (strain SCT) TaxID=412955 RepID=UPI000EBDEFB7|nr:hypothetical protein [Pseudomonas sp. SCT]GCA58208.1 hypothetical protein PSCT_04428 [Pseudomonas sp. SCT]